MDKDVHNVIKRRIIFVQETLCQFVFDARFGHWTEFFNLLGEQLKFLGDYEGFELIAKKGN